MQDTQGFTQARTIVRERVQKLIEQYGAGNEYRFEETHRRLEAVLNADLSGPVLREVVDLADELRRAHDDDADLIDAPLRTPEWDEEKSLVIERIEDSMAERIRSLLTDRVLGEYTARELAV